MRHTEKVLYVLSSLFNNFSPAKNKLWPKALEILTKHTFKLHLEVITANNFFCFGVGVITEHSLTCFRGNSEVCFPWAYH